MREMSTDEIFKQVNEALPRLQALVGAINFIEASNDIEAIILHLEMIEFLEEQLSISFEDDAPKDIKVLIRNGHGDYKKIQEKCIKLKLV